MSRGLGQPVDELSGGNQQKVTVARALASKPKLIVAITPTRGVDVASKELLLASLADITRATGASLLLASDEFDDLQICDRVIVLVRGQVFTEFTEPPYDDEELIAATEGLVRRGERVMTDVREPETVTTTELSAPVEHRSRRLAAVGVRARRGAPARARRASDHRFGSSARPS